MHAVRYAVFTEQHNAEKGGFEKKRAQHFVAQQWPRHIARFFHKAGPVGAKLEAHGNARHHAHCKGQGKDLYPELVGIFPGLVAGLGKAQTKEQQNPAQSN